MALAGSVGAACPPFLSKGPEPATNANFANISRPPTLKSMHKCGLTDGWMDGWMNGWMAGWDVCVVWDGMVWSGMVCRQLQHVVCLHLMSMSGAATTPLVAAQQHNAPDKTRQTEATASGWMSCHVMSWGQLQAAPSRAANIEGAAGD
ncbi:hypothetical protein VFPPC_17704 [Pochonia chlamydosporia 170]|uniref:Uncharacterized protein n=1 Tax=Pochonia chlamydosporia 170 TaxID=1380566 RepID=A0A219AQS8_METCM|nr:hypothetical protein VFPPC_17704 [Pochonia chlamydosporia 170]OWT43120.1 hypothetical protein VFPPC_17704 [Pochonia chlamydosporia 170]